jgi:hypothetical protein
MDILTFFFVVHIALVAAIVYAAFLMVRAIVRFGVAVAKAENEGKPVPAFPIGALIVRGVGLVLLVSALGLSFVYNPKRNMAVYVPSSETRQSEAEEGWRKGMEAATVTPETNAPAPRTQEEVRQQTQDAAKSVKDSFLELPDADQ